MTQLGAAVLNLVTQDNGTPFTPGAVVPESESRKDNKLSQNASPSLAGRLLCCFHGSIRQFRESDEENAISEIQQHGYETGDAKPASAESAPSMPPVAVQVLAEDALAVPQVPQHPQQNLPQPPRQRVKAHQDERRMFEPVTKQREPKPRAQVRYLLPPRQEKYQDKKTLVLDLDETLVHSSFTRVSCEMLLTLELDGERHKVYVKKRPGVDQFLQTVAEWYEVVIFTASTPLYANALLDELDTAHVIQHRLFREACSKYKEGYVKDLSRLGRNLEHVIIIDNLPICYALQPENGIPITTWRDDPDDTELHDLLPILVALAGVDNVPRILQEILCAEDELDEVPAQSQN